MFSDGVLQGDGWYSSATFGYYHGLPPGWIYHLQLEWLYVYSTSTPASWMYSPTLGFLYTSTTIYPFIYSDTKHAWLWYVEGSCAPRVVYNYATAQWEQW